MDRVKAGFFLNNVIKGWYYEPLDVLDNYYHRDFQGQHHLLIFNYDEAKKRHAYARKRYSKIQYNIVEFQVIDNVTICSFIEIFAFDTIKKVPIEHLMSITFLLEEDKIRRSFSLSDIPLDYKTITEFNAENLTINDASRARFKKTVELKNQQVGGDITLTARELDCLYYYIFGLSAKESALKLSISNRTVEKHLENIKLKYQLKNIAQLKEMFVVG